MLASTHSTQNSRRDTASTVIQAHDRLDLAQRLLRLLARLLAAVGDDRAHPAGERCEAGRTQLETERRRQDVLELVALVDHHDPEVDHRRQQGRARTDHDAALPRGHQLLLIVALARTHAAVQGRHLIAEAGDGIDFTIVRKTDVSLLDFLQGNGGEEFPLALRMKIKE